MSFSNSLLLLVPPLSPLACRTTSGAAEATVSTRPEISSAPLVAEQRTAPEVAARVGVLTRQVAAEASIIEKQERESSRKALAEARRRGAASQVAAAQGPTLPAGPARARMVWQPSRVAQLEPAKIVSLSEAVGGGPAKPRARATATGAWGQPALAPVEAAPEVVQLGLGEGMPPVAVNSELCFGPELSDEELSEAIAKVVDVRINSYVYLRVPCTPALFFGSRGGRSLRPFPLLPSEGPSCQRHSNLAALLALFGSWLCRDGRRFPPRRGTSWASACGRAVFSRPARRFGGGWKRPIVGRRPHPS